MGAAEQPSVAIWELVENTREQQPKEKKQWEEKLSPFSARSPL